MFAALDEDQDGFLNAQELATLATKTNGNLTEEE
jgi:Ca2+-binding EF-hand superfamily protein